MTIPNVKLGDKCKDIVSGFAGIATAKAQYMAGCDQILLGPKVKKDGSLPNAQWFDIERIEIVEANSVAINSRPTGGPANGYEVPPTR